ncbi:MAG: DUF4199 domain-containing protein [Bacteroidota bacterium]|nr:MAG: DUF4199 domain-containing protein [Bacteroidota bacterium]
MKPIYKHALTFGLSLGITLSLFELLGYFLGIVIKPIMSLIYIAVVVSMLIIAIRKFRDQAEGGFLSFGNAFLVSFFTCLIAGAIWAVYRFAEYTLAPGIIEETLLTLEEEFLKNNMSEDQIESIMKLYTLFFTPAVVAVTTFVFNMGFGGAILSLIFAAIYKREKNPLTA